MTYLRVLNDRGVDVFRDFLTDSAEVGERAPRHLLSDEVYSRSFHPTIYLQASKEFTNKQDLGRYLCECFDGAGLSRQTVAKDRNFWASIVLYYFDQFCPLKNDGTRFVPMEKEDQVERYPKFIPRIVSRGGEESLRGRRHYALGPFLIFDYNKNTEFQADVLLSGQLNAWGDDVEQTAGRIEVISNRNLVDLIRMLYWGDENSQLLKGYSTKTRPGNINRLVADLRNQMKLTQDWYSMSAQQIYDSLPPEYDYWKLKKE